MTVVYRGRALWAVVMAGALTVVNAPTVVLLGVAVLAGAVWVGRQAAV